MLFVKIMSEESLPDEDAFKNFSIVTIQDTDRMEFNRRLGEPDPDRPYHIDNQYRFQLVVTARDGSATYHILRGNAYVMNQHGKTIASHGC